MWLSPRAFALALAGCVFVQVFAAPARCAARSRGISAEGCSGCHAGGGEPEIRLTPLSAPVPGKALRLLLEIEAVNGATAGFYMTADIPGTLSPVAGQGTQTLGNGLGHSSPKSGSGFVQFEVSWLAPSEPTGVQFRVWAVSANGNNRSSGDGASEHVYSLVSGCDGAMFFRDGDRDGYGASSFGGRLDCEQREGYSTIDGDCNDNNASINPSVDELCNARDDDCDGVTDEGSVPQAHYPDADGDGHGVPSSEPVIECPPPPGYAPTDDDCLDSNATAYPGATEVCDSVDNDCDGQTDERVKPICGIGWCRRESFSCDPEACDPGEPSPELCNWLDDDCDDVLDEAADCGADRVCQDGMCVAASTGAGQGGAPPLEPLADGGVPMRADAGPGVPPSTPPASAPAASGCSVQRAHATGPARIANGVLLLVLLRGSTRRRSRSPRAAP